MTTIAWRDGVLAADSQTTSGTTKATWPKLFRLPDGRAVAFAGDYGSGFRFVECLRAGDPYSPRQGEDFIAIVMRKDGSAWLYENGALHGRIKDKFYAIGSGAPFALGAMTAGATARGAVKAAAQFDCYTGGRVKQVATKGRK